MSEYANWSNGASAKEVQFILQQNFKNLERQIQNKSQLHYDTIKLNFNLTDTDYYTETTPIQGEICSVKFYTSTGQEVYFLYAIHDGKWCGVRSDILPKKDIYCMVIYYD